MHSHQQGASVPQKTPKPHLLFLRIKAIISVWIRTNTQNQRQPEGRKKFYNQLKETGTTSPSSSEDGDLLIVVLPLLSFWCQEQQRVVDDELFSESDQVLVHHLEHRWNQNHSQVVSRHLVYLREYLNHVEVSKQSIQRGSVVIRKLP